MVFFSRQACFAALGLFAPMARFDALVFFGLLARFEPLGFSLYTAHFTALDFFPRRYTFYLWVYRRSMASFLFPVC